MVKKKKKPENKGIDFILIAGFVVIIIVSVFVVLKFSQTDEEASQETTTTTTILVEQIVRDPAVAGTFYPSDANQLGSMIDDFLGSVDNVNPERPLALVEPHAGYVYSGQTAAFGYR